LGTALPCAGKSGAQQITLELNVGKVPVHFEDNAGEPRFGEMTQIDPTFDQAMIAKLWRALTGLHVQDFRMNALPIENCSHPENSSSL